MVAGMNACGIARLGLSYAGIRIFIVAAGTPVAFDGDGNPLIVTDDVSVFGKREGWMTQMTFDKLKVRAP